MLSKTKQKPDFIKLRSCRSFFGDYLIAKAYISKEVGINAKQDPLCQTKNSAKPLTYGIIVSKKVSNRSNVRNLVKRRLRAITQELSKSNKNYCNLHWLFIAKKNIIQANYCDIQKDCLKLTKRICHTF